MTEQTIILPDGRKLGYALYGSAHGWPVLYFHGTPSSRLEPRLLNQYQIDREQCLLEAGLQLIAVDRPGMGLSTFHSGGTFLSFAADAAILLKSLAISRCSLLCWSGGGPYALAMAWQYPSLIKNIFILCGFSRYFTKEVLRKMSTNKWYFLAAKKMPWLLEFFINKIRNYNLRQTLPQWITGLPPADYELMQNPLQLSILAAYTLKEACREGAKGAVYEAGLYCNNFGFEIAQIQQPVHFWWGTEDQTVIRLHAEAVVQQIKNSVLHYKKGEGHFSIYVHCFKEVLQTISLAGRT